MFQTVSRCFRCVSISAVASVLILAFPIHGTAVQPANSYNVITDGSAVGDGVADDTAAINAAITNASNLGKEVYFPVGEYLISGPVALVDDVSLLGESSGLSVVLATDGAPVLGDEDYYADIDNVAIEDLVFLNVKVALNGAYKNYPSMHRCIFVANSPSMLEQKQLGWGNVRDGVLEHCLFLRQYNCHGVAMQTYRTQRCQIKNNLYGLDLEQTDWLVDWSGYPTWNDLTNKLVTLESRYGLDWDQGRFVSAHYPSSVMDETIEGNIYNLSPCDDRFPEDQDHIVYAKGYENLEILGNWFRGDAMDPSGGLKIRNTEGPTVVAGNHFVNTPILQYTYDNFLPKLYQNALIYRNYFTLTPDADPTFNRRGISYWENVSLEGDSNIVYHANVFNSTPGATNVNINITSKGNPNEHMVYESNVYETTTEKIPFTDGDTVLAYSTGSPASALIDPYTNVPIPMIEIPEYGTVDVFIEDFANESIASLSSSGWTFAGQSEEVVQTSNSDWMGADKSFLKLAGGVSGQPSAQYSFGDVPKGKLSLKAFTSSSYSTARIKLLDASGTVLFTFQLTSPTKLKVADVVTGFNADPMPNSATHNLLSAGNGVTELMVRWNGDNVIWQVVNRNADTGEAVYNTGFQEDVFGVSGVPAQIRVDISKYDASYRIFGVTDILVVEDVAGQNTDPVFSGSAGVGSALAGAAYSDSISGWAVDADSNTVVYAKTAGPGWLQLDADGTLSGTPGTSDIGVNTFTIVAYDGAGGSVKETLEISVDEEVLFEDFDGENITSLQIQGWSFSGQTELVDQTSNSGWLGSGKSFLKMSGAASSQPYAEVSLGSLSSGKLSLKAFTAASYSTARVKLLDSSNNVLFAFKLASPTKFKVEDVLIGFTAEPMPNGASHDLLSNSKGVTELEVSWSGNSANWRMVNRDATSGSSVYDTGFESDTFGISGMPAKLRIDISKYDASYRIFGVTDIQIISTQ